MMLGLLVRINAEKTKSDELLKVALAMVERNVEELWADRNQLSYYLTAESVAVLSRNYPKQGKPAALELTMGLLVEDYALTRIARQHSLLEQLEEYLEKRLAKPVRIGMRLYKFAAHLDADLKAGRIDFARVGALRFLRSLRTPPGFFPLVVPETPKKAGVFFTRNDTGIQTLDDIRGHTLALGDTNSTIGFRALLLLAEAGIVGAELAGYEFLDSSLEFAEDAEEYGFEEANQRHRRLFSHRAVIEAVLDRRFDVGVTTPRAFQRDQARGLILIPGAEFPSSRTVLVARQDLDDQLRQLMIEALVQFSGEWLQRLPEQTTGFQPVTPDTFAKEARWLESIQETFPVRDRRAPP